MTPLRAIVLLAASVVLSPAWGAGPEEGYRLLESTAGSVNGEVLFRSDVEREACFYRCGTYDNAAPADIALSGARERLIADLLVLQEQRKLGLGVLDNAAVDEATAAALARLRKCAAPCAREIAAGDVREFVKRRLLVKEFLEKRVSVFVEVKDDDVQMEIHNRAARTGVRPEDIPVEKVRQELYEQKVATETRNWYTKAASKSKIFLSPLEER